MSDIDRIRREHQPESGWCLGCDCLWPCDTSAVLEALDAALRIPLAEVVRGDLAVDARDAARALADELAEALRLVTDEGWWRNWGDGQNEALDAARAALAKWEASK